MTEYLSKSQLYGKRKISNFHMSEEGWRWGIGVKTLVLIISDLLRNSKFQ